MPKINEVRCSYRIHISMDKIYNYFGQVKPNLVKYILICELKFERWKYRGYKGS
jgi:hypothetical protein